VLVRDLWKVFEHGGRSIEVLRGINFDLEPGEMVSVVGASGVGKSTLLHVLGTSMPDVGPNPVRRGDVTA
jgi:lipoprotein-releasing system ATP-binding protein